MCKACATKMGSIKEVEMVGLPIIGDMSRHPSISPYIEEGYQIITL